MIFLTVGTMLPFDRLVKAVDTDVEKGFIQEKVFAQIGNGKYVPSNLECVDFLDREKFLKIFQSSKAVISHAGIGTITTSLKYQKPLLVVPRIKRFNEIVNNHQLLTAKEFSKEGCVLMSDDTCDIWKKINQLLLFTPKKRKNDAKILETKVKKFLTQFLGKNVFP